jgi:hypothetical protein
MLALFFLLWEYLNSRKNLVIEVPVAFIVLSALALHYGSMDSYLYGNTFSSIQTMDMCPLSLVSSLVPSLVVAVIPWLYVLYLMYELYAGGLTLWRGIAYMSLPVVLIPFCPPEIAASHMFAGALMVFMSSLQE